MDSHPRERETLPSPKNYASRVEEPRHHPRPGTFTCRGKTTPNAIRVHQDGLLLQRLYFANEVYNATEIDQGADPKMRDQERTLAQRLLSELAETEFQPEKYEDEYRKRLLKAIEQRSRGRTSSAWRSRPDLDGSGRDAQSEPRMEGNGGPRSRGAAR
jgi:hypothetical protein